MLRKIAAIIAIALSASFIRAQSVSSTSTTNPDGTVTITTIYTPPPAPKVVAPTIPSLTPLAATIVAGSSTKLSWSSTGGVAAVLSYGANSISVPLSSPGYSVTPNTTTKYTLTVTNSAGFAVQRTTVNVTAVAAPTISISTSATSVTAGQSVTLGYTITNATSVSVTDGTNTQSGLPTSTYSASIPIETTTTLKVTATGAGGTTSKSVTITVTPAPTPTPPTSTATGTALTACGSITQSGDYYLSSDVSSPGTCFPIGADNVTLNLNGHTITYGTGGGAAPTPAISDCASWYSGLTTAQCIGGGANLTVYGGTVVQSPGSATFSPVFWMGQGDNGGGGYIHDLTATFQSAGSQFFHGEIDGGGYKIQNNVINDNVTNIQKPGQSPLGAREVFQGYVIHTDEERSGTPHPDDISGNTFNGSPQGGVADGVAGSQIYNNTINLTSFYSNDYGVIVQMDNQNVHDNTVTGRGRGLDGESSGFIFNNNTVNVAEQANNSEYGGCEGAGTYGIRVKNYDWPNSSETGTSPSTNFQITNNKITVSAADCEASALDLTDMNSLVSGTISGNTFVSLPGAGGTSAGLHFNAIDGPSIVFSKNTFTAPTCLIIGGGGDIAYGSYIVASGQTWTCPSGPTVIAEDYTYQQTPSNPPLITIQDTIPSPTLSCWSFSTATVSIGGGFNQTCSLNGQ